MSSSQSMSKDFLELIRSIGEAKSKQEEDKIILGELKVLKSRMSEKDVPKKKMKEYLVRMLYAEMLGHDASFAHIQAVNMTQNAGLVEKRIGYLSVGLVLHEDHELIILLVNTIQRDLKSSNFLEVCAALGAVCKLMNAETIPAVLPLVVDLLSHTQELVRKKAVMALHRFWTRAPSSVAHLQDKFRRALCDRDPSVMNAALCIFYDQAKEDPTPYKDLVPSFVSILKQITEHRLSREYDYHRIPACWIQIRILKVLALLGADDQRTSEGMYEILHEVMKRADTGINAGYAIVYETVRTITSIYPNTQLLEAAASAISSFITSDNQNLRYLGITALASIVGVDRKYAAEHQMVVIECMEDPDETLKRKTLDLLCKITTPANVVVIVDKLTQYLRDTSDHHLRKELVSRVTQLAERYAPDNVWFLNTMNSVFELGGDLVQEETAHNLMRLIAEGSGEDEDADYDLKVEAVSTYADLLTRSSSAANGRDILLHVIAWVCGEYAYVCEPEDPAQAEENLMLTEDGEVINEELIMNHLCDTLEKQHEDASTRGWIISALAKICARLGHCPAVVEELLDKYSSSRLLDLQQRSYEVIELVKNQETIAAVLPLDGSCEDLEVDPDLPFLDGYVQMALASGARPYIPEDEREDFGIGIAASGDSQEGAGDHAGSALRFESYAAPQVGKLAVGGHSDPDRHNMIISGGKDGEEEALRAPAGNDGGSSGNNLSSTGLALGGVKKRWGRGGYKSENGGGGNEQSSATDSAAVAAATQGYNTPAVPAPMPETVTQEELSGSNTSAATPAGATDIAAPAEPAAPATEKEKLAASLFGGGESSASAGRGRGRGRGKGRGKGRGRGRGKGATTAAAAGSASAATVPPPAAAPASNDLLLDLDIGGGSTSSAPAPAPAASSIITADLVDLFGSGPSTPTAATSSAPVLDPFGGPAIGGATTPLTTPTTASAAPADPFGSLLGGGGSGDATASPNYDALRTSGGSSDFGLGAMSLSTPPAVPIPVSLTAEFAGARSHDSQQLLAQNDKAICSYFVARGVSHTAVALFITNRTQTSLTNVQINFDPPACVALSFIGDPQVKAAGNRATFASINAGGSAILSVRVSPVAGAIAAVADILAKVTFVAQGGSGSLDLKLPLTIADLVRPLKITTPEFGAKWKSTANEKKGRIPGMCTSPPELSSRMVRFVNAHPVQTIGQELILAAKMVGTNTLCLFHGKCTSAGVDLMIRSGEKTVSDALWLHCQKVLA